MRSITSPSRRGVLAATGTAALGVALVGCDLPTGDSGDADGDPQGPDNRNSDAQGSDDPDRRRVETVTAQVVEALALVSATVAAHPATGVRLAGLVRCHEAHLALLRGESPAPTPSPTPSAPTATGTPRALAAVRAAEHELVTSMTTEAGAAQSGALARLLAVMSAGLGQHLSDLGWSPPPPTAGASPAPVTGGDDR